MTRPRLIHLGVAVVALALTGLGAWLWTRAGMAVWLENAVSYCLG